jgi:hypothetical protein
MSLLGGLLGAASGLFLDRIFNKSPSAPSRETIAIPNPTQEEQQILGQTEGAINRYYMNRREERPLEHLAEGYFDMFSSGGALSADEKAMFEEEYELQLDALQEQYAMEVERTGASRMAELTSRGVLDSTTGRDLIAEDKRRSVGYLSSAVSELLAKKEVSKAEAEAAKREMARQGYELTSGILQQRRVSDLSELSALQGYHSSMSRMEATNRGADVIRAQSLNQYNYNRRLSDIGRLAGGAFGGMTTAR